MKEAVPQAGFYNAKNFTYKIFCTQFVVKQCVEEGILEGYI